MFALSFGGPELLVSLVAGSMCTAVVGGIALIVILILKSGKK